MFLKVRTMAGNLAFVTIFMMMLCLFSPCHSFYEAFGLVKTPGRAPTSNFLSSFQNRLSVNTNQKQGRTLHRSVDEDSIPEDVRALIEAIYEKGPKVSALGTGGGGALAGWLLGTPGASNALLD
ncbi:unnamed protein product, partial [Heterosigma akashiwo]